MDVATVERFAELHPGVTFKVVSWLSGRVNGRFLVRGNWSRQVRWAEEKRP
ncbi:hypothetical protein [Paludisphaera soli]|uniref:hypothetical protein n=1 Tax=Paludisphaera soli TaxID=2712865 RepID=UPI0013EBA085|nr:hypothetical protein [Paludisphaera soli]